MTIGEADKPMTAVQRARERHVRGDRSEDGFVPSDEGAECALCGKWPCDAMAVVAESEAVIDKAATVFTAVLMAVGKPVLIQDKHLPLAKEWRLEAGRVSGGTMYQVVPPGAQEQSPLSRLVLPGGGRIV